MTIPIPPYVPSFKPVPQVTPFTYRDGVTMLKKLDDMVKYLNRVIVPFVNTDLTELGDKVESDINDMLDQVNAAIDEILNSSVQVQDGVVAGIFSNPTSATRAVTDALYASKSAFDALSDIVNTGRLSQAQLDTRYALKTALDAAITQIIWSTGINVKSYGATGDGVTNDTVAIQAAIDAAQPGQTVIFPETGSGQFYLINATLNVTKPGIRFLGRPRDAYSVSIRTNVASLLMVSVKASGFVIEDLGLIGKTDLNGGWVNGLNCTAVGIELFGDTDGNMDSAIRGATFQYLYLGVVLHGRNAEISQNTLFNNVRNGIKHDGPNVGYNTGPNAADNRGTVIRDSRFHNVGTVNTDSAIEFTANSKVNHLIITGNHFDSNSFAASIVISGDSGSNPARGVTITNNKHTEQYSESIKLYYTQYAFISNEHIMGNTGAGSAGDAIRIENSQYTTIENFSIRYVPRHAISGVNNSSLIIAGGRIIQTGQVTQGDALNFDATNTDVVVENVHGVTGTGYFMSGSPAGASFLRNCSYSSYTLGNINSLSVMNYSQRGLSQYVDGKLGHIEETGLAQYTLVAATLKKIASVQIASNFGAFILTLEIAGRNATTSNAYFIGKRVIRNENGTPNIVVVGTDVNVGLTVAIVSTGPQTFDINVTSAEAALIGCKVIATAAGGASGAVGESLTVTMSPQ